MALNWLTPCVHRVSEKWRKNKENSSYYYITGFVFIQKLFYLQID